MTALLSSFLRRVQSIEDAAFEVLNARAAPVGISLDRVGKIVGRGRGALNDADYLRAIRGQILANRSSGQADILIKIFDLVTPEEASVEVDEGDVATIVLEAHGEIPLAPTWEILRTAKGGGVRLDLTYSPDAVSADDFAFDGEEEAEGFGSVHDATIGGKLRGVFNA